MTATDPPPPLTPEQQADLALGRAVRLLHESGGRLIVVSYDGDEPLVRSTGPARRVLVIPENATTIIPTS